MKYMLFTYRDPSVQLDPEQRATVPAAVTAWCDEMDGRGVRLTGHVLAQVTNSRQAATKSSSSPGFTSQVPFVYVSAIAAPPPE